MSGLAATFLKVLSAGCGLVSVPLTLGYLGQERYGMWVTILSLFSMLGFADLGMGNGLLSTVAEANGQDDIPKIRSLISSAFFMLVLVGGTTLSAVLLAYPLISWSHIFNVKSSIAAAEAGPAALVVIVCFLVALPFSVVQKVQIAFQEGFASSMWQMAAVVTGFLLMLTAISIRGSVVTLALGVSGANVLWTIANWSIYFLRTRPNLRPRLTSRNREVTSMLVNSGAMFTIVQLCVLLGSASDSLIVAHVAGMSEVATFSIVQRMFGVTATAYVFITPMWPAIGEALARGETSWVKRAVNRALLLGLGITAPVALFLAIYGQTVVRWWTHASIHPSGLLLAMGATWCTFNVVVGVMSVVLNQASLLRRQVGYYALASAVALPAKIWLVHGIGGAGIFCGTVLTYGLVWGVPSARLIHGFLKSAESSSNRRGISHAEVSAAV
jgi:O-antigen/teichoic acid export membrane protein